MRRKSNGRIHVLAQFQSTHPSGVRRRGGLREKRQHMISIHAPQWGATIRAMVVCPDIQISIHAPQWGATITQCKQSFNQTTFQSTHPSGVRLNWSVVSPSRYVFQSTHPSGVRLDSIGRSLLVVLDFNPRTPVGCDTPSSVTLTLHSISIHAPQWGATKLGVDFNTVF